MKKMFTLVLVIVLTVGFGFGADKVQAATNDTQKPFVIGAPYDVPFGFVLDIDTSNPTIGRDNEIKEAAEALGAGKNIIVAGGPAGTVSDEMFKSIIEEAGKINPNHSGSIVRIGGQDAAGTQALMMYFLMNVRYF